MGLIRMGPPENLILKLASEFAVKNLSKPEVMKAIQLIGLQNISIMFLQSKSQNIFIKKHEKNTNTKNAEFIYGDSRVEIKKLIKKLDEPTIFWLDAHWSGEETYGDTDQCPLIGELEIINHSRFDNFIFTDDARLFTSPPQPPHHPEQWSDISAIIKTLNKSENERYVVIIEDVIIAVPIFAKQIVMEYCQKVNTKLWMEFSQQNAKSNFRKGIELIYADFPSIIRKFKM